MVPTALQLLVVVVFVHLAHGLLSVRGSRGGASVNRFDRRLAAAASTTTNLEYNDAMRTIDSCSVSGSSSDDLFDAVRYIDRNANKLLYPTEESKNELWDRCKGALERTRRTRSLECVMLTPTVSLCSAALGSWELQLATGGGRFTTFKPVPVFAYAMIDDRHFGNGVCINQEFAILSLLGPHYFNARTRQMGIGIEDMFLFGNKVTPFVPGFMSEGMGLGKSQEEYNADKKRMPTFTMIGASEKSLIARGGTGGIAIWTRLDSDIRPSAYGDYEFGIKSS